MARRSRRSSVRGRRSYSAGAGRRVSRRPTARRSRTSGGGRSQTVRLVIQAGPTAPAPAPLYAPTTEGVQLVRPGGPVTRKARF